MKIQGRKQNILFYSIRGASFKPHFLGSEEIQVIIITGIFLIFQGSPEATHVTNRPKGNSYPTPAALGKTCYNDSFSEENCHLGSKHLFILDKHIALKKVNFKLNIIKLIN